MNATRLARFVCALLAVPLLPGCTALFGSEEHVSMASTRRFELVYEVRIPDDVGERLGTVRVWVPVPVTDRAQTVDVLSHPEGARWSRADEHGNRFSSVDWTGRGERTLIWHYRIERREDVGGMPAGERDLSEAEVFRLYLDADRMVPTRGPAAEVAFDVGGQVPRAEFPAAMAHRVLADLEPTDDPDAGYGSSDYAVAESRGASPDYVAYYASAMRYQDFATRFQVGYLLPVERGGQGAVGMHAWGHWYRPGRGWQPIDLALADEQPERSETHLRRLGSNRVGMSCGRDLVLEPAQQGGPLNYFVEAYAEQDGREIDVATEVRFRDL